MALSDYLTDAEWDACYYAFAGQHAAPNFGESMHRTIESLLQSGYRFTGLDEFGNKRQQLPSNNPRKLCMMWFGDPKPTKADIMRIFDSGRAFLKQHLPALVDETDEDWAKQMEEKDGA